MAKHRYKILSADLSDARGRIGLEPGVPLDEDSEVELDLSREQRTDVIAAGWVEPLDDEEDDDSKSKTAKSK